MPEDDDKYPPSSGRRRFVKGVVGSAGLAGLGTTTSAVMNTTTAKTGAGGGTTQYFGVENTDGPAPRAMPQIPVEIDADGFLKGVWPKVKEVERQGRTVTVAETEDFGGSGITYSNNWFQYCGVQTYPGLAPDADQDNYFRYAKDPPLDWQAEAVSPGDRVNVEDFADYEEWGNGIGNPGVGKPAIVTWRSQDASPQNTMPVEVIRSTRVEQAIQSADGEAATWLEASTAQGFIAHLDKCTHFCCVPAFKAYGDSAKFGAENKIYCQCHQSVYDPYSIVKKQFVALPRPEE